MDLNEIVYEGVECIELAQDIVKWHVIVKTVMNLCVSQEAEDPFTR
jgi:hypothetical protein